MDGDAASKLYVPRAGVPKFAGVPQRLRGAGSAASSLEPQVGPSISAPSSSALTSAGGQIKRVLKRKAAGSASLDVDMGDALDSQDVLLFGKREEDGRTDIPPATRASRYWAHPVFSQL